MLTEIKISKNIYDLQKQIQQLHSELDDLGDPAVRIPELIENSNLIRLNEYLIKSDQKKTNLISIYEQYSKSMGVLLSSVFEIQAELKEILHEQSSLIESKSKSKPKSKPKSKSKPKPKPKPKPKSKSKSKK